MKFKITSLFFTFIPNLFFANLKTSDIGLDQRIDKAFQPFSDLVSNIVFFEVFRWGPICNCFIGFKCTIFHFIFWFP